MLEKESRIRETMKMMGLSNWILWTTWFTKQLLFYLIPLIIISILLKVGLPVYVKLISILFTVWACVSVQQCLPDFCLSLFLYGLWDFILFFCQVS